MPSALTVLAARLAASAVAAEAAADGCRPGATPLVRPLEACPDPVPRTIRIGLIAPGPPHRTDTGAYLVSEVFGARSMIYVKDEDGLYTADPKKDRSARFIPQITVEELAAMRLSDLIIEQSVLDMMKHAEHQRSIQIINGLKPGALTRALKGEHVGTIITA